MNFYLPYLIAIVIYMTIWFAISVIKKRNDVADVAWGFGFVLVAWISFYLSGFSLVSLIVNFLVTIWGTRLGLHIYSRNKNKPEDPRYAEWRASWKNFYLRSYIQVFLLQGILLFLISVPFIFINHSIPNNLSLISFMGILVWVIGFYFESTADSQLKKFISNSENKGHIMDKGLWRYSRHPNYFGEVVQWWGIFIVALSVPGALYTIVGPLTITTLILFVSGIPLLEKKSEEKSGWNEYKNKTSVFIPLPPKTV